MKQGTAVRVMCKASSLLLQGYSVQTTERTEMNKGQKVKVV